jgi:hypothetical protein
MCRVAGEGGVMIGLAFSRAWLEGVVVAQVAGPDRPALRGCRQQKVGDFASAIFGVGVSGGELGEDLMAIVV